MKNRILTEKQETLIDNLPDEILADLDHTAEFFTPQKEIKEDDFDEDGDPDEIFEDDQV